MLLMSLLCSNESLSGYQFATALSPPIPFIFPVKHSQIYPALAALERRADIVGAWMEQRGRPNKKVYRITDQGRDRLRQWLSEPRTAFTKDEALLAAYNLELLGPEAVERIVSVYRRQCEAEKAQLHERWDQVLDADANARATEARLTGARAILEFALDLRDGGIGWCDWVIAKCQEMNSRPGVRAANG
jgi:DNA-binding PadR family transcriptional regulator